MLRHATVTALAVLSCLCSAARGAQSVKLTAGFTPDRLNTPTTISFGFRISARGRVPAPLVAIDLRYPSDVGLSTSGLGLATCTPAALEAFGLSGCPANSLMGHGIATAEIAVGPAPVEQSASITLLAGPPRDGHLDFLVYAEAISPVSAQINFSALLFPEPPPFGGRLHFDVPLVPSIPEAPDVSIVRLDTTLGPLGLTYYERVRGRRIAFHPSGILLPPTCPRGGFPFTADLSFLDGTRATARTTVPCPRRASG